MWGTTGVVGVTGWYEAPPPGAGQLPVLSHARFEHRDPPVNGMAVVNASVAADPGWSRSPETVVASAILVATAVGGLVQATGGGAAGPARTARASSTGAALMGDQAKHLQHQRELLAQRRHSSCATAKWA